MRITTQMLREHLENNIALIVESYIMHNGLPADMASAGHWEMVSEFEADQLDSALYGACRSDSIELVKHVLSLGAKDYDFGLLGACCGNHQTNRDAGNLMMLLGANLKSYDYFQTAALFGNSVCMVTWLAKHIEPNDGDFETILRAGAFNGNMELVNFAIQNGAEGWRRMFFDACAGGDNGMVLLGLMNTRIPAIGLAGAGHGGHIIIMERMLRLGATNYYHALSNAILSNRVDAVRYMLDYITQHTKKINSTALNNAFSNAFHLGHFEIAHLLLICGADRCMFYKDCNQPWELHINAMQSQKLLDEFLDATHASTNPNIE